MMIESFCTDGVRTKEPTRRFVPGDGFVFTFEEVEEVDESEFCIRTFSSVLSVFIFSFSCPSSKFAAYVSSFFSPPPPKKKHGKNWTENKKIRVHFTSYLIHVRVYD